MEGWPVARGAVVASRGAGGEPTSPPQPRAYILVVPSRGTWCREVGLALSACLVANCAQRFQVGAESEQPALLPCWVHPTLWLEASRWGAIRIPR